MELLECKNLSKKFDKRKCLVDFRVRLIDEVQKAQDVDINLKST